MKRLITLVICLHIFIAPMLQANLLSDLREGIIPGLTPRIGSGLGALVGYGAGWEIGKSMQKVGLKKDYMPIYALISAGLVGRGAFCLLYNRTADGIKNQAGNLITEIESGIIEFCGIERKDNEVPLPGDQIYSTMIERDFCDDIKYGNDLHTKIMCLNTIDDYFTQILQKIRWLMPKLLYLKKSYEKEDRVDDLYKDLVWYRAIIRNLKSTCIAQIEKYKTQGIKWQDEDLVIRDKEQEVRNKKDANWRENIKSFHQWRRILYDWRFTISSAIVMSIFGSETMKNLCKQYPSATAITTIGIGGMLFSKPLNGGAPQKR